MALGIWNLTQIKAKTRALSGRLDTNDLSDADLTAYINRYYQGVFCYEVQPLELETYFSFNTVDGTEEYNLRTQTDLTTSEIFQDGFINLMAPITCDGYEMELFISADLFYNKWPDVVTYSEARPIDVLFYNQKLLFRYIPDDAYVVKFGAFKIPAAFANSSPATEYPILEEWGPLISYGAAIEVVEDFGAFEIAERLMPMYERHKNKIIRRTHIQLSEQRSIPKF